MQIHLKYSREIYIELYHVMEGLVAFYTSVGVTYGVT